jgi:hypothetical protein
MSNQRIQMTCEGCGKVYDLTKTEEIPAHVFLMRCNWCPNCEDKAEDYYEEWYDENESSEEQPPPIPDNQLCLPFIFDELEIKVKEHLVYE